MQTLYLVISEYNKKDQKSFCYTIASTSLKDYIVKNNKQREDIKYTHVRPLGKPAIENMKIYYIAWYDKEDEYNYDKWEIAVYNDEKHFKKVERNIKNKVESGKIGGYISNSNTIIYK